MDLDRSAVGGDELVTDVQTEPEALVIIPAADLREPVEDRRQRARGDAPTLVADVEAHVAGRGVEQRRARVHAVPPLAEGDEQPELSSLADALAEAHGVGIIHGDIRPDAIMITPKDRAKFMNFGLARFTAGGATRATSAPVYVAPKPQRWGTRSISRPARRIRSVS